MDKVYTGISLIFNTGGSKTKLAISTDGSALAKTVIYETNQDFDLWLIEFERRAKEMCGDNQIGVICGGIAGSWDEKKTRLLRSPNLREWENRPIKKKIEENFGVPVYLENDVALEGMGEAKSGAGRRYQICVFTAIGSGIGGVKIENGKICPNAFGYEPGHQILDVDGEVTYWEEFAGGVAMTRTYGQKPENLKDPEIWEREVRLLATGLNNVIVMWSPEILILGGGVMKSVDINLLTDLIKQQMQIFPKIPKIVLGELGEKAGLYGALAYLESLGIRG